ncbi:MAG: tagaturonate epimerase family protein, partial [Planctomycetota bacterium]
MRLPKYSMGIGDRFARQGVAQLDALLMARREGVAVAPVWNKSHREHAIVGSGPGDVRVEADRAVAIRGWTDPYFVDADHIGLKTVDGFLDSSDFFTLDVADFIGTDPDADDLARFVDKHEKYVGRLQIPGVDEPFEIAEKTIEDSARKFLLAVREAGRIYRRIEQSKGTDAFVTEISLDETDEPQTPMSLLFILAAVADEAIPAQTIAPRFTGRFNKGVDYVGNVAQFAEEFEQSLAVIAFAVREFGLPENLKLSVHSGSDKFSIYGPMHAALRKLDAGLHLKTAGTTWLEELIGLAVAGGDGLGIAKEIYKTALSRLDELCAPYAAVVDIDARRLAPPETVDAWDEEAFASALRHDPKCEA